LKITHYDLCKKTANWAHRKYKSNVTLFEYQSYATNEFPDVLCFVNGFTLLFEIKVSLQDFKKDQFKDCRIEKKIRYWPTLSRNVLNLANGLTWKEVGLQEFYVEAPHMGRNRFYVCPYGLISPDDIKNGWGLYWYRNNRFNIKKESKSFKANIYEEMRILEHACRKNNSGHNENILIKNY